MRRLALLLAFALAFPAAAQFSFRTTGETTTTVVNMRPSNTLPAVSQTGWGKLFVAGSALPGFTPGEWYISQNGSAWAKLFQALGGGGGVSSFNGRSGIVAAAIGDYNVAQVSGAAPIASPTFTGVPAAPTPATSTNTTQIATTAYVKAQGYLTSAPVASVAGKTGVVTLDVADVSGALATATAASTYAPLASPALTGTPTAPTAIAATNTTQVATTAYVKSQSYVTAATAPVTSVATKTGAVALAVADVSGAAPLASPVFTGTVSGITKTMVELANVDNTSDAAKPVSTSAQTALDLKAPLASPTFSGSIGLGTAPDASARVNVNTSLRLVGGTMPTLDNGGWIVNESGAGLLVQSGGTLRLRAGGVGYTGSVTIDSAGTIKERGRSVAMGEAIAGGTLTYTTELGAWSPTTITNNSYTIIGKTMSFTWACVACNLPTGTNYQLRIPIPGGYTAVATTACSAVWNNGGSAYQNGVVPCVVVGTYVSLTRVIGDSTCPWNGTQPASCTAPVGGVYGLVFTATIIVN